MGESGHRHDAGQAATRLRAALARGDARDALAWVGDLDEAHHVEVLLGAALRDRREDHAGVARYLAGDMPALVRGLADGAGDDSLDRRAARWVAAGHAPEHLPRGGRPLTREERVALAGDAERGVVRALAAGVAPHAILDALEGPAPLAAGVRAYLGPPGAPRIHALGVRPLLVLAIAGQGG
jgi:hypothetical protein